MDSFQTHYSKEGIGEKIMTLKFPGFVQHFHDTIECPSFMVQAPITINQTTPTCDLRDSLFYLIINDETTFAELTLL